MSSTCVCEEIIVEPCEDMPLMDKQVSAEAETASTCDASISAPVTEDSDYFLVDLTAADIMQMRNDLGWARREGKLHKSRADQAEAKYDRMLTYAASLKKDLIAAAAREESLRAQVAELEQAKGAAASLAAELEGVKAAAWNESVLAAEAEAGFRTEVDSLRQQLHAHGIQPTSLESAARIRAAGDAVQRILEQQKAEKEMERPDETATEPGEAPLDTSRNAGAKRRAKKGAKRTSGRCALAQGATPGAAAQGAEKEVVVDAAPADDTAVAAPSEPSSAVAILMARKATLDEQRRLEEQRLEEARRREEEEQRERAEEELERQRQREEEEAREARRQELLLEQERLAQEEAPRKAQKAQERKKQRQEREQRLAEEQKALPREEFLALQAMRAELDGNEPEKEDSPFESDEDALLDREMARVRKEEYEEYNAETGPGNFAQIFFEMQGMSAPGKDFSQQMKKAQQAKRRAALKEKLQTRRELDSMLGSAHTAGRRSR